MSAGSAFGRALVVLADQVADLRAAEQRCFDVKARSRAIEHQVGADAVRSGMIAALTDYLLVDRAEPAALSRVDALINDAVVRRGGVAPAEWPPRPGDLWRTDDDEGLWVALLQVTKHIQEGALWLMQVYGGDEITHEDLLAKFGPDVLRLVYREEQGGGEPA